MLRHILVPLDGSRFGEQAIPLAVEIARTSRATVELVHVHDVFAVSSTLGVAAAGAPASTPLVMPAAEVVRAARSASEAYVRTIERQFGVGAPVSLSATLLEGNAAAALARHANAAADLVIMTTHGRGGLARFWLGSVADGVVREATVPILLLKPSDSANGIAVGRGGRLKAVLVPLDGSPLAERVLEPVIDVVGADAADVNLTLMLVQQPIAAIALSSLAAAIPTDAPPGADGEPTMDYLESVAERVRSRGLRVHTRAVVHTSPARAIIEQANESGADVVAMATHGRGGIRRLLIGSTTDKVLRGSDTPLLLYRPPEA
jgi:nucleotide-binding universal stress UspA family protein